MKSGKLTQSTSKEAIEKKIESKAAAVIDETTEIMKNTRTDIIIIIDRSSSTEGLEGATCAGYNNLVKKERESGFNTRVTTVFFDDNKQVVCFRKPVGNVPPLVYTAYGNTRLYDTLCETIKDVRQSQLNDPEPVTNTVVYIMTDGADNRSRFNNSSTTSKLIQEYINSYGWEFLFLGALSNAQSVAADLGIPYTNAIEIEKSMEGIYNSFVSTSKALDDLRTYGKLTDGWASASKKNNNAAIGSSESVKRLGLK